MFNENWPRWIAASIQQHFIDTVDASLPIFIEGQEKTVDEDEDFIELRIDGPNCTQLSKNDHNLYVEVNVLIQSHMNETDFHMIHKDVGKVLVAFTDILIYKYGDNPGDDDSFIVCLRLLQGGKEAVRTAHFGQIDPDKKLIQSTVEGHFEMDIET